MEELIPFIGMGGAFLTIILIVLTKHQRHMAVLLHRPQQAAEDPQLRYEINDLRQMIAQQAITIDNLAAQQERLIRVLGTDEELRKQLSART
jgi:hypothetical protein